ncbi:MAG: hypothetical protein Q8877_03530 [Sweet potato little leaf phytoplasma]|nr:hypothetical protein [Sweet potato little leaf phytoplasma]
MVEKVLNRIGYNVGLANQPSFILAFPEWVQHAKIPRGMKIPKLSKFAGEAGESTIEHIARYTIELGDFALEKALKMRLFPSSLTKNVFSWFSTLRPNSIHEWNQ